MGAGLFVLGLAVNAAAWVPHGAPSVADLGGASGRLGPLAESLGWNTVNTAPWALLRDEPWAHWRRTVRSRFTSFCVPRRRARAPIFRDDDDDDAAADDNDDDGALVWSFSRENGTRRARVVFLLSFVEAGGQARGWIRDQMTKGRLAIGSMESLDAVEPGERGAAWCVRIHARQTCPVL